MSDVHATLMVEYSGTAIAKTVRVKANGESDATNVNRAIEMLTKQVQVMVQSAQGVT